MTKRTARAAPRPETSAIQQKLHRLVHEGRLLTVAATAELVLGHRVTSRTALRWAIVGRGGLVLPTIRGINKVRSTTEAAFRGWLAASSGGAVAAAAAAQRRQAAADDAALESFGLPRRPAGAIGVVGAEVSV